MRSYRRYLWYNKPRGELKKTINRGNHQSRVFAEADQAPIDFRGGKYKANDQVLFVKKLNSNSLK